MDLYRSFFAPAPARRPSTFALAVARVALALVALALPSCQKQKLGPEEVLRTFLADVASQRADAAWAALTDANKKTLEARHAELAKAAGKPADPQPAHILFEELELMRLNSPETIAVVSPLGYDVTLRVTVKEGKSADIHLVREGTAWKIDLLGSLQPAAPLGHGLQGPKKDEAPKKDETETSTTP